MKTKTGIIALIIVIFGGIFGYVFPKKELVCTHSEYVDDLVVNKSLKLTVEVDYIFKGFSCPKADMKFIYDYSNYTEEEKNQNIKPDYCSSYKNAAYDTNYDMESCKVKEDGDLLIEELKMKSSNPLLLTKGHSGVKRNLESHGYTCTYK